MLRTIKLLPQQIPFFWEAIKKAWVEVNRVEEKDTQVYLNYILHSLLNDKSQCFVHLSEDKVLLGMFITSITFNKITGIKELRVLAAYAWQKVSWEEREKTLVLIKEFAVHAECKKVIVESKNPVVWGLCDRMGMREAYRIFTGEV